MSAKTVHQDIVWHYGSKPKQKHANDMFLWLHTSGIIDTYSLRYAKGLTNIVAWAHVRPVWLPKEEMKP